jgi:hypothetical protein
MRWAVMFLIYFPFFFLTKFHLKMFAYMLTLEYARY